MFPKINLRTQDIGKDAFGTHVAYSACLVIPLGWLMPYNIPISYEQISSPIPKEICARVFFGDIHIYRKSPEEHKEHAEEVLEVLRNNNFLQNSASVNSTRQK